MDSDSSFFNAHKKLKEEFVSNLTGSSMLEIVALSAIMPVLILLRQWTKVAPKDYLQKLEKSDCHLRTQQNTIRNFAVSLILDFALVVLPMLSVLTVLANWAYILSVLLMILAFFIIVYRRTHSSSSNPSPKECSSSLTWSSILTLYRFSMMLVTCLTILAVDFPIFPRRYAKTETYGTGLMDLGVGSFVVANGLVSREARNLHSKRHGGIFRTVSPLLVLGIVRLIATKGVEYQVHVGEYGVHWNFFFTLAAVEILSSILKVRPPWCALLGCLILVVYQAVLLLGLNDYLISNQRYSNIFTMNKEGIFSLFGYLGLYLISVSLGHHFFVKIRGNIQLVLNIWVIDCLLWTLTVFLSHYVEKISRRMCNFACVTFVLAQNFEVIGILALNEFTLSRKAPLIVEAFDQNLLASFLLANLLTGLVNVSLNTLSISSTIAFGILIAYSVVLISGIAIPKFYGIRLKFW